MFVRCYENVAELEPFRTEWEALAAGCTFRSWTWLSTWWRHYGERVGSRQLRVIAAFADDGEQRGALAAVLPCYLDATWARGRALRLLGDGEVCSDHAGLLVHGKHSLESATAIANYLALQDDWDVVEFAAVDADDVATLRLHASLAEHGCVVSRVPGDQTWAIGLPSTWEEFLARQSKSHRKQLRQAERRVLDSGDAEWRPVTTADDLDDAWGTLIDLHQRRRRSLGEPGCFASPPWAAFHREVAGALLAEGRLRLSTLTLAGAPAAAEYHFAGDGATFAYQGGVDPSRLADEPGRLSTIRCIQQAIAEGHGRFDLLRGDEPYKAHWRATPRPAVRLFAVPPRGWSQLRHASWQSMRGLSRLAKQLTGTVPTSPSLEGSGQRRD